MFLQSYKELKNIESQIQSQIPRDIFLLNDSDFPDKHY